MLSLDDDDDDDDVVLGSVPFVVVSQSDDDHDHGNIDNNDNNNNDNNNARDLSRYISLVLEISGSCGDFGTLIPLLVAMARGRTIYLAPTLFLSGVAHLVTGWYWDLPMPLQPMKAIASLAIAQELTRVQVTAAGIGMGVCFLFMSVRKDTIEVLNRWIPQCVIGGLQLGVGWKLALKGIHMIQGLPWWFTTSSSFDCITLGIVCSLLCLYGLRRKNNAERTTTSFSMCRILLIQQPPVGIILFLLGIILASVHLVTTNKNDDGASVHTDDDTNSTTTTEPLVVNALRDVTWEDWRIGLLSGTLTQLPLTTLNSCLSVCMLAHTLFPPHRTKRVSRRSVCVSIGLINSVLCPLGMMPTCHGAGGLAGQHRLGAKSGTSMIVLGLFKISMGIVASQGYLLRVLDALPVSILGVLLALAGHELATAGIIKVARASSSSSGDNGSRKEDEMTVCLITALVILGTGHAHVGALCGWITYAIYAGRNACGNDDSDEYSPTLSSMPFNERGQYTPLQTEVSVDLPVLKYGYRTTRLTWQELIQIINVEKNIPKLSRSEQQQRDYEVFRYHMKRQYASSAEYILISKFGFRAVSDGSAHRWKAMPSLSEIEITQKILVRNDFPYYVEEGVSHYVLWKTKEKITKEEIVEAQEQLKTQLEAHDILYWTNPPHLQSLPEIDHVHFLCRISSDDDDHHHVFS
jgi:hypothetical protein